MNVSKLRDYFYSILLNTAILYAVYLMVQPDPKGIAFGVDITFYGIAACIAGLFALKRIGINRFIYTWIATSNLINIYLLIGSAKALLKGEVLITPWILIELFFVVGAFLAVFMTYHSLKEDAKR